MMMRLATSILLILLFTVTSVAKENAKPLNATIHLVADARPDNISHLINRGVEAFSIEKTEDLSQIISACNASLQKDPNQIFYLFTYRIPDNILKTIEPKVYTHTGSIKWPTESDLIKTGKHFIVFAKKNIPKSIMNFQTFLCRIDVLDSLKKVAVKSDFVYYNYDQTDSLLKRKLYAFWDYYAHPVNFIFSKSSDIDFLQKTIAELESESSVSGCFTYNEKKLTDCYFKQNTWRAPIYGFFCIPFKTYLNMSPLRTGMQFPSEAIHITKDHSNKFIEIKGELLPLNVSELLDINFEKKPHILYSSVEDRYTENIEFKKDSVSGKRCAYFNGESGQISFKADHNPDDDLLNLSADITFRYTNNDNYHALISQGKTFSFKLYKDHLVFTLPQKHDYLLKNIPVEKNKWTHISFTIFRGQLLRVYDNGILKEQIHILETRSSNEPIQIGNNNSFEMFIGYISEIRVWNRTLSEFDIKNLMSTESSSGYFWWFLLLIPAVIIGFSVIRKRKKRLKQVYCDDTIATTEISDFRNSLLFFGGISLYSSKGENLTMRMSPKIRLLFSTIAWYSFKGGISTHELTNIVWPGMNKEAAKNNRGTSIASLRELLQCMPHMQLVYEQKNWLLHFDDSIYVDYAHFLELTSNPDQKAPTHKTVIEYCSIIRGRFLLNVENEWSDNIKSHIHDKVMHQLEAYAQIPDIANNPVALAHIVRAIYAIDELNEEALEMELHVARLKNKPEKEYVILEKFNKKYKTIYGASYTKK